MQFFIKRGDKTQGPISHQQLLKLVNAKRIVSSDLVSKSAEGPFQELKAVWNSIKQTPDTVQKPTQRQPAALRRSPEVAPAFKSAPPLASEKNLSIPQIPVASSGPKWILIGGILGGALLVLSTVIAMIFWNLNSTVLTDKTGMSGTANAGKSGTANAGKSGTANAAKSGTANAGKSGTANAGKSGTANAGKSGTASNKNAKTYDRSTPEKFAIAVFDTLKNDDVASHMALITITPKEFAYCFDQIIAKNPEMKGEVERARKEEEEDGQKQYAQNSGAFKRTRKAAAESGINWESARLVSATFNEESSPDIPDTISGGEIYFIVSSGEKSFKFKLDDCVSFQNQWRCGDGLRFYENNLGYVVPDKIEKFPPRFTGRTLSEYFREIRKMVRGLDLGKGKFEKTKDFERRIATSWPNATLFDQPFLKSRWVYVYKPATTYDADSEMLGLTLSEAPSEVDNDDLIPSYIINLENIDLKTKELNWTLPPKEAQEVTEQLRVAYVFRLGLLGNFPYKNSYNFIGEKDLYIGDILVKKGEVLQQTWDLWVEEAFEAIVFRYDTGEILKRVDMRTKPTPNEVEEDETAKTKIGKSSKFDGVAPSKVLGSRDLPETFGNSRDASNGAVSFSGSDKYEVKIRGDDRVEVLVKDTENVVFKMPRIKKIDDFLKLEVVDLSISPKGNYVFVKYRPTEECSAYALDSEGNMHNFVLKADQDILEFPSGLSIRTDEQLNDVDNPIDRLFKRTRVSGFDSNDMFLIFKDGGVINLSNNEIRDTNDIGLRGFGMGARPIDKTNHSKTWYQLQAADWTDEYRFTGSTLQEMSGGVVENQEKIDHAATTQNQQAHCLISPLLSSDEKFVFSGGSSMELSTWRKWGNAEHNRAAGMYESYLIANRQHQIELSDAYLKKFIFSPERVDWAFSKSGKYFLSIYHHANFDRLEIYDIANLKTAASSTRIKRHPNYKFLSATFKDHEVTEEGFELGGRGGEKILLNFKAAKSSGDREDPFGDGNFGGKFSGGGLGGGDF